MKMLTVTSSPHIASKTTTRVIMLDVIIALLPAVVCAGIQYGFRAPLLIASSSGMCVLIEYLWCRIANKPNSCSDLSAVVTGILLALNVPATLPLWQLVVGDVVAIAIVKQLFGGLGCNFINPALVGRITLAISFPQSMTAYASTRWAVDIGSTASAVSGATDAVSGATPLAVIAAGNTDKLDFLTLLFGRFSGVMSDTCAIALILGGAYLIFRRVIKPIIPLCFIGSTFIFSLLFGSNAPFLSLFAGGLILGSFFMATDYVTSPYTNWGKVVFAVGCGLITSLIRVYANSAEGVSYAIVLMNLVVPYINDFTRKKPFGGVKKA